MSYPSVFQEQLILILPVPRFVVGWFPIQFFSAIVQIVGHLTSDWRSGLTRLQQVEDKRQNTLIEQFLPA